MTDDQPDVVPLALAAERLGLSTEAVRKRIQRGTLPGHKVDGAWCVDVSALPAGRPDNASSHPDTSDQTSGQTNNDGRPDVRTGSVDLTPLVEMIDRLHEENQRLTEATTVWQLRARQAEERLQALEAGPIAGDMPQEHNSGPPRDEVTTQAEPYRPASDSLALTWRRWWRRITGSG